MFKHKPLTHYALLLPLFFAITSAYAQDHQGELQLVNPSFESGDNGLPFGWTSRVGRGFRWEDAAAHTGQFSARIDGTMYRNFHLESDPIPLNPQRGYTWLTLSGFIKTQGSQGDVYLALAWYNTGGKLIGISGSETLYTSPQDWTPLTLSELPPEDASHMTVWCASDYTPGTTWFDSLHLNATVLPRVTAAPANAPPELQVDTVLVRLLSTNVHRSFLADYPDHPLAVESAYQLERQKFHAAQMLLARKQRVIAIGVLEQVSIQRPTESFFLAALGGDATVVRIHQIRYEKLIDETLYELAVSTGSLGDYAKSRQYFEAIVERQKTPRFVVRANRALEGLESLGF